MVVFVDVSDGVFDVLVVYFWDVFDDVVDSVDLV